MKELGLRLLDYSSITLLMLGLGLVLFLLRVTRMPIKGVSTKELVLGLGLVLGLQLLNVING